MNARLPIEIGDLEPVKDLCERGIIPFAFDTAKRYCRDAKSATALRPQLPAKKVAKNWMTTRTAVKAWLRGFSNSAMRRVEV